MVLNITLVNVIHITHAQHIYSYCIVLYVLYTMHGVSGALCHRQPVASITYGLVSGSQHMQCLPLVLVSTTITTIEGTFSLIFVNNTTKILKKKKKETKKKKKEIKCSVYTTQCGEHYTIYVYKILNPIPHTPVYAPYRKKTSTCGFGPVGIDPKYQLETL